MIDGDINEFVDKLWGGEELIYVYNGKKYFSQGYTLPDGRYRFELQIWEPYGDVLWEVEGLSRTESLEEFFSLPLFGNKKFWDIEQEITWVDE